jgi:hypothetical protein
MFAKLSKEEVVNELDSKTLKNYIRKAVAPQEKKSAVNLASKGGFKLGSDTSGNLEAGEKEDKKAFTRAKGIQRAAKKLYSRTDKVNEYNTGVKEVPMKAKFKIGKAKPIPGNPAYKGPQNPKLKVKLNKTPGNMKNEAIQRRMDRKTIIATDPATGRKVIKIAPKREVDIGKGRMESVDQMKVNELKISTMQKYKSAAKGDIQTGENARHKGYPEKAIDKQQDKRYKGIDTANKRIAKKQVKMAKGIAFDKRYKGGNMTGASKAINKIKSGLADHPKVSKALRTANEQLNQEGE